MSDEALKLALGILKMRKELNSIQAVVFPGIRWLLSTKKHEREGRTHLLAVAAIEAALDSPNSDIPLFDHRGPSSYMSKVVKDLIDRYLGADFQNCFEIVNNTIRYIPQTTLASSVADLEKKLQGASNEKAGVF